MKADRRHQLASNALARELEGIPGRIKEWGNTALTVVLVVAAIAMLIRWRLVSAEQARLAVLNELSNARSYVEQTRSQGLAQQSPQFLANFRQEAAGKTNEAISTVLNTSDDPKVKAQALITRGDLYWQLANFPELPGAATQPSLRASETSEEYLKKAADAYNDVLKTDEYVKQHDAVVSAHFGLAAIAENRHDWDEARRQLELIANDTDALPVLSKEAKSELETQLPQMQTPMYVVPATQAMAIQTTTEPASQPSH